MNRKFFIKYSFYLSLLCLLLLLVIFGPSLSFKAVAEDKVLLQPEEKRKDIDNIDKDNGEQKAKNQSHGKAILLNVKGAISPVSQDYIQQGLMVAEKEKAKLVILQLDTPGGLDTSMREIVKSILASKVPVVVYIAPHGARAASAGTYILYASHVAAMADGTNVGAASPVQIGGFGTTTSEDKNKSDDTMAKKTKADASAFIRSLAELRNRNVQWAERSVTEASSLSSKEAEKLKVIDVISNNISELLQKIDGKTVKIDDKDVQLNTSNLSIEKHKPDWRYEILSIITDPTIAYILLLIGIYGLFFELSNPGFVMPGVLGGIALLLALYAFQLLPINYAGFALLLLGIGCMMLEAYYPSFGALGIGGLVAFVLGSLLLMDLNAIGFSIAWQVIAFMSILSAVFFIVLINLAIASKRKKIVTGRDALIGCEGMMMEFNEGTGLVRIFGELWQAKSSYPLKKGEKVKVVNMEGLHLKVEPIQKNQNMNMKTNTNSNSGSRNSDRDREKQ